MKEIDILELFYDEMKAKGLTRGDVSLSMDEGALAIINVKTRTHNTLKELHELTDVCIANEWLYRTTADPHYRYLSLSESGLQRVLNYEY